uniref:Uncharacterized protein n=1 Tax=Anguilla anguilla TaxID=7936 RepID=A0A0E9P670_ANGAN
MVESKALRSLFKRLNHRSSGHN